MAVEKVYYSEEDLQPIVVPVVLGAKQYELWEADEDIACRYRNASAGSVVFESGEPRRIQGIGDVEPMLVAACLREVIVDKDGQPTGAYRLLKTDEVRRWRKPKVIRRLFDLAKEISGLNEEEDTEENLTKRIAELTERLESLRRDRSPSKNEPDGTEANSG